MAASLLSREVSYESAIDTSLWTIARLDGKNFGRVTRRLVKPFDFDFVNAMRDTAEELATSVGASLYFVQSNEITLVFSPPEKGEFIHGGRVMKLCSLMAGEASARFSSTNINVLKPAIFDCRVFSVRTKDDADRSVSERRMYCRKNAIQSLARSVHSHRGIQGKTCGEMIEMLLSSGIDWYASPDSPEKVGYLATKETVKVIARDSLGEVLPRLHEKMLDREVERRIWVNRRMSVTDKLFDLKSWANFPA